MRGAFTILELIFVIIILGILAAIALPRLTASKDEAEISKALSNIKTIISDLSSYALKNDMLSNTASMSNVTELENVDLSNFTGTRIVKFKVGNDEECVRFVFINESNVLALGIATNDSVKTLIENLAKAQNQNILKPNDTSKAGVLNATNALINADFTSTSSSKACVSLSNSLSFKNLANKNYILLGN
ncbi:prepilin-type N-terminal cleavage/methylation domain-containing protein [Campylobacter troglodytis]|uniref:prepilin-type N-terminal cleavage/methylation domain-containing protein n=1 Tax=Campylobacter troglodytis TaxID=654363 RepID=UPI001157F2C5|nr:prepilin-type N-terminal cleavage/methylation domain-containing protein [Campylobacter troglodytis]TQR60356.1 prepilin-type cleavage/methylation domain-containing protein [Campylobacter troglodytis]